MLKVISFNLLNPRHGIEWGIPQAYDKVNGEKVSNWQSRFDLFKEFIKQEDPDIILLQETPGFVKQAITEVLSTRVGSIKKGDLTNKNTAILLKDGQDYSKVKVNVKHSDKTVIKTTINGKTAVIASMHITGYNLKTREEKQKLGHADLASVLNAVDEIDADIKIVGGDYNEHTQVGWPRYDKMIEHGYETKINYDVTEANSKESIDAIFCKGTITPIKSYAVDIKASDHYAVVYEFKLED